MRSYLIYPKGVMSSFGTIFSGLFSGLVIVSTQDTVNMVNMVDYAGIYFP